MVGLRDLVPGDSRTLLRWRNMPEVAAWMYTDHQITEEEHAAWFARLPHDPTRRDWMITCDGQDVGFVNIYQIDRRQRRCYWAFYIADPSVRGRGVGSVVEYSILSHVFERERLFRLCCEVLVSNEAVIAMHESFGFAREGLLRQHIWKGGSAVDVVTLAILQPEWEARRPAIDDRLRRKGLLPESGL